MCHHVADIADFSLVCHKLTKLITTKVRTAINAMLALQAVLMDFGSARPARVTVRNRTEALSLQEEAEKLCSAPYRAPELFDVASQCVVDERIDVWSLGCVLYFMLYGCSPFERVLEEAGGSLALAVINGSLTFPSPDVHSSELRQLVLFCLKTDPQTRPHLHDVMQNVQRMLET